MLRRSWRPPFVLTMSIFVSRSNSLWMRVNLPPLVLRRTSVQGFLFELLSDRTIKKELFQLTVTIITSTFDSSKNDHRSKKSTVRAFGRLSRSEWRNFTLFKPSSVPSALRVRAQRSLGKHTRQNESTITANARFYFCGRTKPYYSAQYNLQWRSPNCINDQVAI